MKLLFSVPSGYHLRELLMPLHHLLEQDTEITHVFCITPAAPYTQEIFSSYSQKFEFIENPSTPEDHELLFKKLAPDLVITDTVGHDEKDYPILKAAQALSIPTLTFIASWDNVWKIDKLLKSKKPVAIADHFIVWNEMMKNHLHRTFSNLTASQVSVIGAPRLDYFWHSDKIPTKQQLYSYLGFTDTSRPLIHFSTTELYPMDYIVKAIHDAVKSGNIPQNPYLYASVHPGGKMDGHKPLEAFGVTVRYSFGRKENAPLPSFMYTPSEQDLYYLVSLFTHADVLINHSSSTALESLIAKTPVVNVNYGRSLDWWKWYRSMVYRDFKEHYADLIADDATYVVKNKKELVEATKDALENPDKKADLATRTVQKMITTTDGTASQKVLDTLKSKAHI